MQTPVQDHGRIITIEPHILEEQRNHPEATGVLTSLLYDLALAGKYIASQTTRAGLAEILGSTADVNIQGEQVIKLDRLADRTIFLLNDHTGRLAVLASEEHEDILPIPEKYYLIGNLSAFYSGLSLILISSVLFLLAYIIARSKEKRHKKPGTKFYTGLFS